MIDPADPEQLDRLLRRHRIDPRRSLGQNFLVDVATRDRIAETAGVTEDDDVLEVGAGAGALSVALAPRCARLTSVEIDRRLASVLREVLGGTANVKVLEADILGVDIRAHFPHGGEIVAGNIPYNLTGALIRKLLDREPRPRRLSLVVQKEVAERWTATTAASLATVAVQVFAEARLAFTIPPAAFKPEPRVDSACVVLDVRASPAVDVDDMNAFLRMVESVFQLRRKQLGGTLGRISGLGRAGAAARLLESGIDPERRPQTLTLGEWETVYRSFGPAPGG